MRHEHEERDAEPGAEQHRRAENVDELECEDKVGHRIPRQRAGYPRRSTLAALA